MPKVKLEYVDRLFDILYEFGKLTYLQELIYNNEEFPLSDEKLRFAEKHTRQAILESQIKAVHKFEELLLSDDFAVPMPENKDRGGG